MVNLQFTIRRCERFIFGGLEQCHVCQIYCAHTHGITVDLIPIPAVLLPVLSPLPRFSSGYRGFPAVPIPMQLSSHALPDGGGVTAFLLFMHTPFHTKLKQEAQLMLTNLRDAFRGQLRSQNIAPFHMLGIVSYY